MTAAAGFIENEKGINCIETSFFLQVFNEKPNSIILEVGSNDESSAACKKLVDDGHKVIGVDLREPNETNANKAYEYVRGDFCDLPSEFLRKHVGRIDSIFSISALEHFGLAAYSEGGVLNPNYDSIAMHQIWQLLKEEGTAYISVPFGSKFTVLLNQWRVYDEKNLWMRLIQDFTVESILWFFSGNGGKADGGGRLNGRWYKKGSVIPVEQARQYSGDPPHLTVFMKLRKISKPRKAPDGIFT